MFAPLQNVLSADPRIAYALAFGSSVTGQVHPQSDVDIAIGVVAGAHIEALELGALISRLEEVAGRSVDLVLLDEAPPGLAYRIFRNGRPLVVRDERALKARLVRAILEYLDFRPIEELFARGVLAAGSRTDSAPQHRPGERRLQARSDAIRKTMVDKALLAANIAAVRDAAARIRAVLPSTVDAFVSDRTAREIVVLNLFVALQECVSLAAHWLADDGLDVPPTYAEVFRRLGEREVISTELAARLAAASGFRNLVAHRYAALDWRRVHTIASERLDDLLALCDELARRAR